MTPTKDKCPGCRQMTLEDRGPAVWDTDPPPADAGDDYRLFHCEGCGVEVKRRPGGAATTDPRYHLDEEHRRLMT